MKKIKIIDVDYKNMEEKINEWFMIGQNRIEDIKLVENPWNPYLLKMIIVYSV